MICGKFIAMFYNGQIQLRSAIIVIMRLLAKFKSKGSELIVFESFVVFSMESDLFDCEVARMKCNGIREIEASKTRIPLHFIQATRYFWRWSGIRRK